MLQGDGHLVARHDGGQTPFTADVTDVLGSGRTEHQLVVRAEDDPTDPDQARGKQDWRETTRGRIGWKRAACRTG